MPRRNLKVQPVPPSTALNWVDGRTGEVFATRADLKRFQHAQAAVVLRDFESLVKEHTLGQKAWDQIPGETALAYSRFRAYLGQLPHPDRGTRSITRLAETLQVKMESMFRHSTRYHWALRAKLYDQYQIEQADIEFTRERRAAARRQARLGMQLQSAATRGLDHLRQDPDRLGAMTPLEITKMAEAGQRVERLARGDSTENTDTSIRMVWQGPQPTWAPQPEPQPGPDPGRLELTDGKTIDGTH